MSKPLYIDGGYRFGEGHRALMRRGVLKGEFDLIGFEPNPHVKRLPLWVQRAALADFDGTTTFHPQGIDRQASGDGSSVIEGFANALGELMARHGKVKARYNPELATRVRCVRLSTLLDAMAKGRPRVVVKLDIEGMEYNVLEDLLATGTAKLITDAYIEFHHWLPGWEKTQADTDLLKERLAAEGVTVHYHG